ncbi:MAG: cupin domain-containing protein [Gammaproteobacteria bacterium]|nr:cupin domain-containing protein [Gammaproteobacteria bacterium]MDH3535980.1 cupin domain-containing protein [Gammaproteobacteria bacterium]
MSEIFGRQTRAGLVGLPVAESLDIDAGTMDWQDCGAEGFYIKPLLEDGSAGMRTWLMKVGAGAFSPLHAHDEFEQIYVLEGSFYDQHKSYGPGEFIVRAPGAMHSAGSEDGAIVLLFYSPKTGG